jgi:hypothetical protein
MEEKVSKEVKLAVARDIVSSYVRGVGASGNQVSPHQVCEMLKAVYETVETLCPEPERRRVGLGV